MFSLKRIAIQEKKTNGTIAECLAALYLELDLLTSTLEPLLLFLLVVSFFKCVCSSHMSVTVKFRDPQSGLDCDINVNDRLGLINSSMIKEYCDAHPFVRPLLRAIKEWAKPLGLNYPSPVRGSPISFSSYALTLMTISFLQVRSFRYTTHYKRFQLLNLCDRKRAICLIYRGIFPLLLNPTGNSYGLVNLIKAGMFAIIQLKIGFRHLFLILIHCCLRGTRRCFFALMAVLKPFVSLPA